MINLTVQDRRVLEYVSEHPGSNATQVAEGLGLTREQALGFLVKLYEEYLIALSIMEIARITEAGKARLQPDSPHG